jgi:hypothetical protein
MSARPGDREDIEVKEGSREKGERKIKVEDVRKKKKRHWKIMRM